MLRELYLPPFRAAVDAGAGAVMTVYNAVNGTPMSDHEYLLGTVLKGEWGFEGFVVSDWFGTEDPVSAANGGLDVEMPGITSAEFREAMGLETGDEDPFADFEGGMPDPTNTARFAETLEAAVDSGAVSAERLRDMAGRVLSTMDRFGRLDGGRTPDTGALDAPDHRELAATIATRGTVLLENDGILPLDDDSVALVGPNVDVAALGGGGSSEVTPSDDATPVEGIPERGGDVTVERGLPPIENDSFFDSGPERERSESADKRSSVSAARDAADRADVAVVFVRDRATEAADRETLRLPGRQDELVEAVAAANDRTVVVINSSGPDELPWREEVAAIVENWYPGQAHGRAVAAVLYGDVDPGSRLPVTFASECAYPTSDPRRFPGAEGTVHYEEGLLVGYPHFDANELDVAYPFGHGESYANYEYGDLERVDPSTVRVRVTNTAERAGREVVQAYVGRDGSPDDLRRPVRRLAGFTSVSLLAGATRNVEVDLDGHAFARYDVADGWTVDPGAQTVDVGRSSRDLRGSVSIEHR